MPNNHIGNIIKHYAYQVGFNECGFAKIIPLNKEIDDFKLYLDKGYNANMMFLEKNIDKRQDPTKILNTAKSIIVTALSYYIPKEHELNYNKISRYAWLNDYHTKVLDKLNQLIDKLQANNIDADYLPYVDTGPILEKIWAVKAGIGWQGKNSLIINKKMGTWFFIGIILTSLELQSSQIHENKCGNCELCINNCPTNAIENNCMINANKCIAYWTIESKLNQEFPDIIKTNQNGWVWGCDICQEVCPYNKKVSSYFSDFNEKEVIMTNIYPNLIDQISENEYKTTFANKVLSRSNLLKLKRNIK